MFFSRRKSSELYVLYFILYNVFYTHRNIDDRMEKYGSVALLMKKTLLDHVRLANGLITTPPAD